LESTKKDTKCPICNRQTFGVFNRALKLIKKLQGKEDESKPIVPIKRGRWVEVAE